MQQQDLNRIGEINALLGRGTEYDGKLCFEGRVRIDGRFRGSIHSEDMLILGEGSDVDGEIHVGKLIVRGGTLRGRVFAMQLVELFAPARVYADIQTPLFFVDRGVLFEGRCTMGGEPIEPSSVETGAAYISSPGLLAAAIAPTDDSEGDESAVGAAVDADASTPSDPDLTDEAGEKPRARRRKSRKKGAEPEA